MFADSTAVQQIYVPQFVLTTKWHNPTEYQVMLELHVKTPQNVRKPTHDRPLTYEEKTGNIKVVIPPGETIEIPSIYDRSIQYVRGGVVQSGQAPQLRNMGAREVAKVHPALDSVAAEKKMAATAVQAAVEAKAETEAKLAIAMAELTRLKAAETELAALKSTSVVADEKSLAETGRQFVQPPNKNK